MTAYEPDQDGFRWGHFFDTPFAFNSAYGGGENNESGSIYPPESVSLLHYDMCHPNHVEDGAESLCEGIRGLGIGDTSHCLHPEEPQLPSPGVASYCWSTPSMMNYYPPASVHEDSLDVANDRESSSSCSSPGERLYDDEDYPSYPPRFNDLIPVPHIPRINGEIPSIDEATSDHQRLLDRLQLYDLVERKVQGDGNCQFRSLSDQFYRTTEHHDFVRQQIVSQLKCHPEIYEGYVPMEYGEYLKKMSKSGEWGDHVTLQAAADSYGVKIFVITSFKDTCYIEILPMVQNSKRVIFLSFWAEVHYNSIYPQGDLPPVETKKKKKWWPFRHRH